MTLSVRLGVGLLGTALGALFAVLLFSVVFRDETSTEPQLIVAILLGGLPVALAAGAAAYLYGRSLTRRLTSVRDRHQPQGFSGSTSGGDVVAELGGMLGALQETIGSQEGVRSRMEEELRNARAQLREVATYLEAAREGERKRIARDIHDELGQALSTLKLDLSLLGDELGESKGVFRERIEAMTRLVGVSMKSVKRIISELRPQVLDDLGLTAAIEWQAEEFQKRTGISAELSIYPQEIILEPDQSTALFRIFQEALANVAQHANAHAVRSSLTEIDGVVELEVEDDGRGISREQIEDPRSFGLVGIRERAHSCGGTAEIEGSAGHGTRVRVRFTLPEEQ